MRSLTMTPSARVALAFDRACAQHVGLGIQVAVNSDVIPEWSSFAREVFARLVDPTTPTIAEPLPVDRWAVGAHRRVEHTSGIAELRASCAGSPAAAAVATERLLDAVAKAVRLEQTRARIRKAAVRPVDPTESRAQADALAEIADREDLDAATREAAEDAEIEALRNAKHAETVREAMGDAIDETTPKTVRAFDDAVVGASAAADEVARAVRILRGCGVGGPSGTVEDDVPMGLLTQLASDPALMRIVEMMGRLVASAGAQVRAAETGRCDVVGVELGGDVGSFVPVELALLGTEREDDLMRRTTERGVVSWEYHGEDAVDRGDMLLMFDRSGSMKGARLTFARAVIGAMIVLGRKQRRRVVVCAFNHAQEIKVMDATGAGFGDALSLVFLGARGGTEVGEALRACQPYAAKADACIVTDGVFGVDEGEAARWLRAAGGQIHVVGLGCAVEQHASWATRVVRVDDVNSDDVASRLVVSVINRGGAK